MFSGTIVTDDLRVINTVRGKTIQAYKATNLTLNDGLAVNETLTVDTITKRLADDVTVDSNVVVGGIL